MAQGVMKEALDAEDFKRWERGQPLRKKAPRIHPDPKQPKVDKLLTLDKIKLDQVALAKDGRRKNIRNKEGTLFMGYNVALEMKDGKAVKGWMPEADFVEMRRILFREGVVNVDAFEY